MRASTSTANARAPEGNHPRTISASGWEFGLQGGFDFTSSTSGFGPYLSLSTGQFSDLQVGGTSTTISEKKFHETFLIGVRGFFKL